MIVVFCFVEDGPKYGFVLELFGDMETFGYEGLVKEVAAFVDVEVSEEDEVLMVGMDVFCPVGHPFGNTFDFFDSVG